MLPDAPWQCIEPSLPPPPKPKQADRPGRHLLDNRMALVGILFELKTGINREEQRAERLRLGH